MDAMLTQYSCMAMLVHQLLVSRRFPYYISCLYIKDTSTSLTSPRPRSQGHLLMTFSPACSTQHPVFTSKLLNLRPQFTRFLCAPHLFSLHSDKPKTCNPPASAAEIIVVHHYTQWTLSSYPLTDISSSSLSFPCLCLAPQLGASFLCLCGTRARWLRDLCYLFF